MDLENKAALIIQRNFRRYKATKLGQILKDNRKNKESRLAEARIDGEIKSRQMLGDDRKNEELRLAEARIDGEIKSRQMLGDDRKNEELRRAEARIDGEMYVVDLVTDIERKIAILRSISSLQQCENISFPQCFEEKYRTLALERHKAHLSAKRNWWQLL